MKVALIGDSQVGKTCLMTRYVEGSFDETQLHTQGVNFMEKTVQLESHEVTFSIWDIGGHTSSETMLPLVCNDAAAVLLMFDLTRPETLDSIREWHRKARALNKCAMPLLIGCKYDLLLDLPSEEHAHMCNLSRRFAAAINAPLIFCAPSVPINVTNVFKVILIRLFGLAPAVPILRQPGEPWIIYERVPGEARELYAEPSDVEAGDVRGTAAPNGSVSQGSLAVASPPPPSRPTSAAPPLGV